MADGNQQRDLADFWSVYDQIHQEGQRSPDYNGAAQFWNSYQLNLTSSADMIKEAIGNVQSARWTGSASSAMNQRMSDGLSSITAQLNGAQKTQQAWSALLTQLDASVQAVDTGGGSLLSTLLNQNKLTGTTSTTAISDGEGHAVVSSPDMVKITTADRGTVDVDAGTAGVIDGIVGKIQAQGASLASSFQAVTDALNGMPAPQWTGPKSPIAASGPGQSTGAGASGAAGGAKKAGGAAAAGGAGAAGAKKASGAGAAGGATSSTGTGTGSASGTGDPSSSSAGPSDGTDLASSPESSNLAGGADNTSPPPLVTDPTLAGSPTGTLAPGTDNPATGLGVPTPVLSGTSLAPSSSSSVTPFAFPSLLNSAGGSPGSTTEKLLGSNGTGGGGSVGGIADEPGPTLADEPQAAGSATSTAGGYYPPMMPPMRPGSGGSGSGVPSGEADGAGGPAIRWAGRDSRRAGLVPELQGRGSGQDAEPADDPMRYSAGDQVLDEELWQVAKVVPPVTPPELQSHRGRSRGF